MQDNKEEKEVAASFSNEKVLSLALDLGKSMVQCGAEINRVEETVRRVCFAYGIS